MELSKNQKTVGALGIGVVLVAGLVGTGAVTTLTSVLSGNEFDATISRTTPPTGALVEVSGAPLTHTFDVTKFNDSVEGTWTIENKGTVDAPYDGTLAPHGEVSASLAQNLTVEYSDGTTWYKAGTLDAPLSYAAATGRPSPSLAVGATQSVPVRITLDDPTLLQGEDGANLRVSANFTVTYTDTTGA